MFFLVAAVDNASELLVSLSSGNLEEFYPSAAIASLMKILKDPSLSQHHTMVIQVHLLLQETPVIVFGTNQYEDQIILLCVTLDYLYKTTPLYLHFSKFKKCMYPLILLARPHYYRSL